MIRWRGDGDECFNNLIIRMIGIDGKRYKIIQVIGKTEAEGAFRPWWDSLSDYILWVSFFVNKSNGTYIVMREDISWNMKSNIG